MDGRNPARTVKLESAADLVCALSGPSRNLREAVLRAIIANPGRALELGKFQGQDVIDELVQQASNSCSVPYYRLLVRALAGFEDPRVHLLFEKISVLAQDEQILEVVQAGRTLPKAPAPTGDMKDVDIFCAKSSVSTGKETLN